EHARPLAAAALPPRQCPPVGTAASHQSSVSNEIMFPKSTPWALHVASCRAHLTTNDKMYAGVFANRCNRGAMSLIFQIDDADWRGPFSADVQRQAATALEDGRVLFFPNLSFTLLDGEGRFLRPDLVTGAKQVSYDPSTRRLAHCRC